MADAATQKDAPFDFRFGALDYYSRPGQSHSSAPRPL
jgi:hypothetical protein